MDLGPVRLHRTSSDNPSTSAYHSAPMSNRVKPADETNRLRLLSLGLGEGVVGLGALAVEALHLGGLHGRAGATHVNPGLVIARLL